MKFSLLSFTVETDQKAIAFRLPQPATRDGTGPLPGTYFVPTTPLNEDDIDWSRFSSHDPLVIRGIPYVSKAGHLGGREAVGLEFGFRACASLAKKFGVTEVEDVIVVAVLSEQSQDKLFIGLVIRSNYAGT